MGEEGGGKIVRAWRPGASDWSSVFKTWQNPYTCEFTVALAACIRSSRLTSQHGKRRGSETPTPKNEELLAIDSFWERGSFSRVWPLVGWPCSGRSPHTQDTCAWQTGLGGLFFYKEYTKLGGGGRAMQGMGWIWLKCIARNLRK